MNVSSASKKRQIVATLAVLIVIAVIGGGLALNKQDDTSNPSSTAGTSQTNTEPATAQVETAETPNATYKDGTYTAIGGYNSPGGAESIEVSVTLKDGKITNTFAKGEASDATAKFHQEDFIGAYKELITGKDIDTLKLNRVAGASLTTNGFNNAIEQIKSEAEA